MDAHRKLSRVFAWLAVLLCVGYPMVPCANGQEGATPAVKPQTQPPPAQQEQAAPAEKKAPTTNELVADLKSGPGEKRMDALSALLSAGLKDHAILQPLLDVMADDAEANKEARPLAVKALANLKDANLTPIEKDTLLGALIKAIQDKDRDVKVAAIIAIGAAATAAEPALLAEAGREDAAVRVLAFQRLALIYANQPPLPKHGPPPAPAELLKALEDENADVKNAAAMCFWAGGFADKPAITPLLKMFDEKSENNAPMRTNALHALGSLRSAPLTAPEQKPILDAIQAGLKDESPDVRYYAAWGIQSGDKAILPDLEALVTDVDPRVRAIAHEKLYYLRQFAAAPRPDISKAPAELVAGLGDADLRVRAEAVRAFWLGGYKDAAAVGPLLAVFDDKSDDNRMARLDALRVLANLRATPLADVDKGRITAAIISGLNDPYFAVRYQAAKSVTAADAEALPALQAAATDDNPLVQAAVKDAIQRLEKK